MSRTAAIAFTLDREIGWYPGTGGYDRNPTLDGVTQGTYDTWRAQQHLPQRSVKDMSHAERQAIYEMFWDESHAAVLPSPVDMAHFAFYFNTRPSRAYRALQRALGVTPDGVFGPVTAAAAQAARPDVLFPALLVEQLREYREIVLSNTAKRPALLSWVGRLVECWKLGNEGR